MHICFEVFSNCWFDRPVIIAIEHDDISLFTRRWWWSVSGCSCNSIPGDIIAVSRSYPYFTRRCRRNY